MTGPYRALACIDRDGTLIPDKGYLSDPGGVELLPRAPRALRLLRSEGVACVLTTNQSGVARGYHDEFAIHEVHERLEQMLRAEGAELDAIYYSTAHEKAVDPAYREGLHRRKPMTGMADEARRDLGLADAPLFAIGDKTADVQLGINAGGRGILVLTGEGAQSEALLRDLGIDAPIVPDAYDAARRVLLDLALAMHPEDGVMRRKLRTPGELARITVEARATGRVTVFANGCFDILHGGHISYLENARSEGDCLILALNSNASIRRLKGAGRPVLPEADRLQVLAALEAVDYITVFHTDSADEALEEIHPDVHAKGTDYSNDNVPELQTTRRLGIRTVIAGAAKENSTRDIIGVIRERTAAGMI